MGLAVAGSENHWAVNHPFPAFLHGPNLPLAPRGLLLPSTTRIPQPQRSSMDAVSCRRRHRRWILWAGAAVATCLIYHHPAVASRRRRIARLASALASLADAVAAVASDLAAFLRSDSDALPPTLAQISKLASSPHASASVSALSGALTAGVLRGYASANPAPASGGDGDLSDRLVDKLLSPAGERLASAVAGSFGRQLVLAVYSSPADPPADSSTASWVELLTTRKCERAIRSWVEVFTATAVGVFIDKTIHINTYDQLCAAATNPAYDARIQQLLVALCGASVETLVRTSHSVLSNANRNTDARGSFSANNVVGEGWAGTVSTALAVPTNRKLVLDLTGRATFDAVRSFLEFVLWRLHDAAKAGGDATVSAGLCVLRYMSQRSIVIATICIALCLHVLYGTWLLAPA